MQKKKKLFLVKNFSNKCKQNPQKTSLFVQWEFFPALQNFCQSGRCMCGFCFVIVKEKQ